MLDAIWTLFTSWFVFTTICIFIAAVVVVHINERSK